MRGLEQDLTPIGRAGGRIRRFAEAIDQAHAFGHGPGDRDDPWTLPTFLGLFLA